jgi:hypothetical protein
MSEPEQTALEQFAEIDAAVWFDAARNGLKKCAIITMHDRRIALYLGRAKLEDLRVSEAQARAGLQIRKKIESFPRSGEQAEIAAPFARPKSELQIALPNAARAAAAAMRGRSKKWEG